MNYVIVRPWDIKSDIVILLAVQHPKKPFTKFQEHWDKAKARVIKLDPETWTVGQVLQALKDLGWVIMELDPITVEY